MSNVIFNPRIASDKVAIGPSREALQERMVSEKLYHQLEARLLSETEEHYRKGYEAGKQSGFAGGMVQGKSEAQRIIDQMQPVLVEIIRRKNEIFLTAEQDLLNLATILAEKIVGGLASSNQDLILETIRKSLPILVEKSRLTVKVAPEQMEFVQRNLEKIMAFDKDLKEIRVESDRRVSAGGCVLETSSGRVDARIEKQLEVLTAALLKQIPAAEV